MTQCDVTHKCAFQNYSISSLMAQIFVARLIFLGLRSPNKTNDILTTANQHFEQPSHGWE
jgi:hypothetical protein